MLSEDVHEGKALQGSTEGEVGAWAGWEREETAVDTLLGDHLHHRVSTASPRVRDFLHVPKGISPTRDKAAGALVVLHLGPGCDGGRVTGPE